MLKNSTYLWKKEKLYIVKYASLKEELAKLQLKNTLLIGANKGTICSNLIKNMKSKSVINITLQMIKSMKF